MAKPSWGARAMQILFAFALIFGLAAAALGPLQATPANADPGAELEVDVNVYLKNPDTSEFTPLTGPIDPCEDFYVNATVVNSGDAAAADVEATISIDANASLVAGESATKDLGNIQACGLADVWWLVHCDAPGMVNITVVAEDGTGMVTGSGSATVAQTTTPPDDLLEVTPVEYPEETVTPCTTFGIKASVRNISSPGVTAADVVATITIVGPASIVGGDPDTWPVGDIKPGDTQEVGWTLHCDGPGDVTITVDATSTTPGTVTPWSTTVHQKEPATLVVHIDSPVTSTDICTTCPWANFQVTGTVTNTGDVDALSVTAAISTDGPGGASITPPYLQSLGDIAAGASVSFSWDVACTSAGDVTFSVDANGYDAETSDSISGTDSVTVHQKNFLVDITAPVAGTTYSSCQDFDVSVTFRNCTGEDLTSVTATLTIDPSSGASIVSPGATQTFNICSCCEVTKDWTLHCDSSDDVTITVEAKKSDGTPLGDDSVAVVQEWKAHLVVGMATYLQDENGIMQPLDAFTPCQDFHVVIPVFNTGEATAEGVAVTVNTTGPATISGPSGDWITGNPEIPGGEARKMILLVHCDDEGDVTFTIPDPEGVTGTDENTGESVLDANKCISCPLTVKQIPLEVEIIEPTTCTDFLVSDDFTVKAKITNSSTLGQDIGDVCATLIWSGNAELVQPQTATKCLGDLPATSAITGELVGSVTDTDTTFSGTLDNFPIVPGSLTVELNGTTFTDNGDGTLSGGTGGSTINYTTGELTINFASGSARDVTADYHYYATVDEITWQMHCTGPGDVDFWVTATATDPNISATSDDDPETSGNQAVTVHQSYEATTLSVEILSPSDGTYIATSEEFAVTATITNTGDNTALGVSATVGISPPGKASVVGGPTPAVPTELAPGQSVTTTWTLHCNEGNDGTTITVTATAANADDASDTALVRQYPAAHLVVDITEYPVDPIAVCSDFVVTASITNTGEADAWEVSATLSVEPEGSVRVTEGGYTQAVGTLAGHGQNGTATLTWHLHCKQACESTITITAAAYDEYGWHLKQLCELVDELWVCELILDSEPGRAIDERFIEPMSVTVKQVDASTDLAITKSVDDDTPEVSDDVEFTIIVTNNGPGDATGVEVTDVLPAGLSHVSHDASQGTYCPECGGVWDVGSIAQGQSAILVIDAHVDEATEVTNTAAITAMDQADPVAANNSDSVTLNQEPVTAQDVPLGEDWNLMSLPLIPNDPDIEVVLASVIANVGIVWHYDAATGTWSSYIPGGPPPTLTTMNDGKGYWMEMTASDVLTVDGVELPLPPQTPPTYDVVAGWNLIGFKSTSPRTAGDYLAAIDGKYTIMYGYASGVFFVVQRDDLLQPGLGYWIAVTEPGTIYP